MKTLNLLKHFFALILSVYVLLDSNGIVTATHTVPQKGYIEAPSNVECGWKKLPDGTWQAPDVVP